MEPLYCPNWLLWILVYIYISHSSQHPPLFDLLAGDHKFRYYLPKHNLDTLKYKTYIPPSKKYITKQILLSSTITWFQHNHGYIMYHFSHRSAAFLLSVHLVISDLSYVIDNCLLQGGSELKTACHLLYTLISHDKQGCTEHCMTFNFFFFSRTCVPVEWFRTYVTWETQLWYMMATWYYEHTGSFSWLLNTGNCQCLVTAMHRSRQ